MPSPVCLELRTTIVREVQAGATRRAVAERYGVSIATTQRLLKRLTETGSLTPDRIGGYKRSAIDDYASTLSTLLQEQPDITLDAMRDVLKRRHGLTVSSTAMHAAVHRLGLRSSRTRHGAGSGEHGQARARSLGGGDRAASAARA